MLVSFHFDTRLLIRLGLVYLLHAYDYCPEDPMICLCLAIASIGRAMQRQSDNRQHLIAQVCSISSIKVIMFTGPVGNGIPFKI